MPEINKFWGDDEHDDEDPQDFIDSIEILFLRGTNATDTQRLRAFELHLKSGSVARQWYNALTQNEKDTWEHLTQAFGTRWPNRTPTVKTKEEKQAELEGTLITEEEVGKRVKKNGVEELAHVAWANKVERLATAVPDTSSLLIGNVRKRMPKVLQKITGSGHATWASFCNAIRTATPAQIEDAKEEEKEARDLKEEVKRLQELRNTPARDLANAFQRLTMSPSNPTPRFATPWNQPHSRPGQNPPQTHFANHRFPHQSSHHNPNPPPPRQYRSPATRMADVIRLALPIHPNTPAGRASYNTQIAQWNANNPRQILTELQPHPLSPGTSPVASGECWKCGTLGHMGPNCDNPNQVPQLEYRWRSIAATIKRSSNAPTTESVNFVSTSEAWSAGEEYDQQVIANFFANQGKEQGSST
jgi:hypothetical protein